MPKITTNIQETSLNPFAKEDLLLGTPKKHIDPYKGSGYESGLEGFSSYVPEEGYSLLGDSNFAKDAIQERLALNQTGWELAGKFLTNTAITFGTELAKTPGYVGGAVLGLANEAFGDGKDSMGYFVDNAWINAFESLSEEAKAALPVHISKSVQEGGLWDKVSSGAWWATSGADGVGFLLSMMIPGRVIAGLGIGKGIAGLAESLGATNKTMGKILSKTGLIRELRGADNIATGIFKASEKGALSANHAAAATFNTFIESAAEGGNTYDNVYKTKIAEGMSEEEAKLAAGDAAASVFRANLPLLMMSNMLEEAWLWKGFNVSGQKKATNQVLQDLLGKGYLDTSIVRKGFKEGLKTGSGNLAKNFAKEGFLEEGLQTRIQQAAEDDKSVLEAFDPVKYFEDLTTNVELQESIFLGGVLGGGMSMVQTVNDIKNYNNQMFGTEEYKAKNWFEKMIGRETMKQEGLKNVVEQGFINSYKTLEDYAKKDDQGNVLRDPKGRMIMDIDALANLAKDKAELIDLHRNYDLAVLENDRYAQDQYGAQIAYNTLQPFLEQEGGLEAYKKYTKESLVDAWAKQYKIVSNQEATEAQKKEYADQLIKTAENMQRIYDEVNDTHFPEKYVKYTKEEKPLFNEWKQLLFNQKINDLLQSKAVSDTEKWFAEEKAKRGLEDNISVVQEIIAEKVADAEETGNLDADSVSSLLGMSHRLRTEPNLKKDLNQRYLDRFTEKHLVKSWNDFKAEKKRLAEELEKEVTEDLEKAKQNADQAELTNKGFMKSILDNGYDAEVIKDPTTGKERALLKELVFAKDKDGNEYRIQTIKDKATGEITTYAIDAKGTRTKLTSKFIREKILKVVSKAELEATRAAFRVNARHQSMMRVMDEIIAHKRKNYEEYKSKAKEAGEKLTQLSIDLKKLEESIEKERKALKDGTTKSRKGTKRSLRIFKDQYKQLTEQIKNLEQERERLLDLKAKFQEYLAEYETLRQELQNNTAFSFKMLKETVDDNILTMISKLQSDLELGKTVVDSQKAIDIIDEQIVEVERLLEHFKSVRTIMRDIIEKDQLTKQLVITAAYKGAESLRNLEELINLHPSLKNVFDSIKNQLQEGVSVSDILDSLSNQRRIKRALKEAANSLEQQGLRPEEVFNYMSDNMYAIEQAKSQMQDYLGNMTYDDFFKMENELLTVENEIAELYKQLNNLKRDRQIHALNKRSIVLEEILSDKVELRFNQYLAAARQAEIEQSQLAPKDSVEASSNPEHIVEEAALLSELGTAMFSTTGRNMQWNKTENRDELHEEGELKGLPVMNESIYQQHWFKLLDNIALKGMLNQYELQLYVPKYDDSSELEKQIANNNPTSRSESDVVAILINKKTGEPVIKDDMYVFSSIWTPQTLYANNKPRIAPNTVFHNFLSFLKVKDDIKYKENKDADHTVWKNPKDQTELRKALGIQEGLPFTVEDVYQAAIEFAKEEYTNWYNSVVEQNKAGKIVKVTPEGISKGHLVQRKDENGNVIWKPIEGNLQSVRLSPTKKFGTDQLEGATLHQAPPGDSSGRSSIQVGGKPVTLKAGDTVLVLSNEKNVVPLRARTLTDEEAELVMYLMSLGMTQGFDAQVELPKGKYYNIGGKKIENAVRVFAYEASQGLQNFGLLHTILNYGRKNDHKNLTADQRKGEISVATKTQSVYYVDFNGKQKMLNLKDVKAAVDSGKFASYSKEVGELFAFLKEKRINISRFFVDKNPLFLRPKLVKLKDGGYKVEFDTEGSYYDFLFRGDNPILSTSAVKQEGYPSFANRNIYFNPKTSEGVKPVKNKQEKDFTPPEDDFDPDAAEEFMVSAEKVAEVMGGKKSESKPSSTSTQSTAKTQEDTRSEEQKIAEFNAMMESSGANPANTVDMSDPTPPVRRGRDKILTNEEMLEYKIKNNEIIKECL